MASAIAGQTLTAQAGKVLDSKNAHFAKGIDVAPKNSAK